MELLFSEEELLLKRTVRDFAERELAPRAAEVDEREEFPWDNFRGLASLGLTGLTIDPKYGGSGGGYRQLAIAEEEIARACAATGVILIAHLSLGTQAIYQFSNEEQKLRFIPPLAKGERLAAFALTEPGAGSDAASLQTTATKRNNIYYLNGSKTFITNGDLADTIVVFATQDRSLRSRGISAFIVEKGYPGFQAVKQVGKMGMRGSVTAELSFQDCPVPEANRLAEEGFGFKIAMQIIDASRIAIAAQAVGIAQAALEAAVRYAQQRQQFGRPIAEFQGIQFMLADMATHIQAARCLTLYAATLKDRGLPFIAESSMAKLFASEAAVFATSKALQIHGGYGYFKSSPVERYYRDAKVTEIYEGTSEVQRIVIARNLLQAFAI